MLPSNDVYKRIGQSVVDSIDLVWQYVTITATLKGEGVLAIEGAYISKDGLRHVFVVQGATIKEFYNLYMQMAESPKGKWKKMIFKMTPDGQFEVNFDY